MREGKVRVFGMVVLNQERKDARMNRIGCK